MRFALKEGKQGQPALTTLGDGDDDGEEEEDDVGRCGA
jgi:hypothetical protein